jgi:hypothetical protein
VLRFSQLETFARTNGLSLSTTSTEFVLRVANSGHEWARCRDLDAVAAAIERYLVQINKQAPQA